MYGGSNIKENDSLQRRMHMCLYECGIVMSELHDWCMSSYYVQK